MTALIDSFEKNRKLSEQAKTFVGTSEKKMSFLIRIELEFIYLFKKRKNIVEAYTNLRTLKKMLREIYKKFSQSDIREKNDIFLEIEKVSGGLVEIVKEKQYLLVLRLYRNLTDKFTIELFNFKQKLKKELFGDFEKRSDELQKNIAKAVKDKNITQQDLDAWVNE
ncbi:hypothetical protein [Mucilaginibacter sp. PPCGB 2223]|uniref:hypothetical protein n=1 Tax=Mucilaginibacter sp. PPCGB 2223 TaxID=1886027 RepID=UPI001111A033|nr:hypothetical protein [Mucilaginibacter sp. PPCGB 2223]